MAGKRMGIEKALEIVSALDVTTLEAIEVVQGHYSNMPGVIIGLRIMKKNKMGLGQNEEDTGGFKH